MASKKYDYSALKLEFFQSDTDEVRVFIKQRLGQDTANNKQLASKTKGRWKEKIEYKQKLVEKAIERNAEKQARQLEIPIDLLLKAKKVAIGKIMTLISSEWITMNDLAKWLEKIKTELWEPSSISKNDNTNITKVEPQLNEDDKEFLAQLVEKRYGKKTWWTNRKTKH